MIQSMLPFTRATTSLFVQLNELYIPTSETTGGIEWRETSRWIKYEENLEFGADRWGKPHVPALSFHDLLQLRDYIEDGVVLLNLEAPDFEGVTRKVVAELVKNHHVTADDSSLVYQTILLFEKGESSRTSLDQSINSLRHFYYRQQNTLESPPESPKCKRTTSRTSKGIAGAVLEMSQTASCFSTGERFDPRHFMKRHSVSDTLRIMLQEAQKSSGSLQKQIREQAKGGKMMECFKNNCRHPKLPGLAKIFQRLPEGSEAALILVGAVEFVEKPTVVFLRLEEPLDMSQEGKVLPVPVRFFFILLGSLHAGPDYHETGRAMGTLLSQKEFQQHAYAASSVTRITRGINEFLDQSIVLPPGRWDQKELFSWSQIRTKSKWLRQRKRAFTARPIELEEIIQLKLDEYQGDSLRRSGNFFGGLRKEVLRFPKHFKTDILNGFNMKCFSSILFLFCVCFVPTLTFGAIFDTKTDGWMGVRETLTATSVGGMIFSLFSTQPLLLIGVTGPMLVFEQSLFMFCTAMELTFLEVRFWTAVWGFLFCTVTVSLEGCFLIQYLTRFSDDILTTLVSAIFIYETALFITRIFVLHPVTDLANYCNQSRDDIYRDHRSLPHLGEYGFRKSDYQSISSVQYPNTALLTLLLLLGTFMVAWMFHSFQNSNLLSRKLRRIVGNLGLSFSVAFMVLFDWLILHDSTVTQELQNTHLIQLEPTRIHDRDWIVLQKKPELLVVLGSAASGFLFFLVLFVETEATEMLLADMKPTLRKGTGYHWDLMLSGLLAVLCGAFGLPWLAAAALQSKEHVSSLTIYSMRAPGQKPQAIGVVEQRVTSFVLSLLIGLSLLGSNVLHNIPVPVLFGVFLYLGITNLREVQLLERVVLLFVPVMYHPTKAYCLRVRTQRMHKYTGIQFLCLVFVTVIKKMKVTAFAFPFGIMVTVVLRHLVLPKMFSNAELNALDNDEEEDEYEE